ncbi:PaaI family thioesterase [Boudabousia marimammalium]|uniref:Thioesterase domain-containing protein n=1 Tax=Boudabousia marimammalium TaxID=156892 RepID=A0A1Q5PRG7_9ACTO|nr:PaaI family thioesterase [Boudabousia marimammalium]OKL50035.1 hypothetical protein BM477_03875 [Boudabousia marimammalium]
MTQNIMDAARINLVSVSPTEASATMPVEGNTQPFGVLHGGATALLLETVGSYAAHAHAQLSGCVAVGTELSVSHLRSVRKGTVHAFAQAQHTGKSSAVYVITVRDDTERIIATGRLTCRILEAPAQS